MSSPSYAQRLHTVFSPFLSPSITKCDSEFMKSNTRSLSTMNSLCLHKANVKKSISYIVLSHMSSILKSKKIKLFQITISLDTSSPIRIHFLDYCATI